MVFLDRRSPQSCPNVHLAGLDRIRVSYLREGKLLETEVDMSAARRNFLSSGEDDDVDED